MQARFLVYILVSIDNFYGQNLDYFETSMVTLTLLKHWILLNDVETQKK